MLLEQCSIIVSFSCHTYASVHEVERFSALFRRHGDGADAASCCELPLESTVPVIYRYFVDVLHFNLYVIPLIHYETCGFCLRLDQRLYKANRAVLYHQP